MKSLIVANWKANKGIKEAATFIKETRTVLEEVTEAEIVLCPSFMTIPLTFALLENSSIKLGAQDVSSFDNGPYTGEVTGEMLSGVVSYCLVGHSERRRLFGEDNEVIRKKIEHLRKYKITPILCARDERDIPEGLSAEGLVVAYEPSSAISTEGIYHPDTPENAKNMAKNFKEILGEGCPILYGGSVNEDNTANYLSEELNGVLVGNASLDPQTFLSLVSSARLKLNVVK